VNTFTIVGIILIAAGVLALVYGQFSYVTDSEQVELGPLEFEVRETETVNIPQWAGVGAIIAGVVILLVPLLKKS
jgi:uncharacterized membrane protein YidH (DUF202 family)